MIRFSPPRVRCRVWALVALVLLLHVGIANRATWDKGSTFDEYAHIGNGVSFWSTGDYRMYPFGIATYRWMTLPLIGDGHRTPAPSGEIWRNADTWAYSRALFFELGNDAQGMLRMARCMTSVLSAALGLLVFVWARSLFGPAGGVLSLLLYALNPTVLAHGSAATLDVAASLAFTAAMGSLWAVLHRLTPARLAVSGLAWGLAITAKFSTLLLVPLALLLAAVRLAIGRPWSIEIGVRRREVRSRGGMIRWLALVALSHAAAACLTMWLMYGFRFEMHRRLADGRPDPAALQVADWMRKAGSAEPVVALLHRWRLVPEAFLYGACETMETVAGRNTFLDGRFSTTGFRSYFPLALLYKTPVAVLVVGVAAIAAAARRFAARGGWGRRGRREPRGWYATLPLWVLLAGYGTAAIASQINIGIRHLLPVFPAAFILMGAAGAWLRSARAVGAWLVAACLAWLAADAAAAFPNYLAYFNPVAGGSARGYRRLVDSSFDWGQELPALKAWLDARDRDPARPSRVYLSYFGSTPPSVYGIRATMLPCYFDLALLEPGLRQPFEPRLSPGTYVVSATMLQSVYNPVAAGPWRRDYEQEYLRLTEQLNAYLRADEAGRRRLVEQRGREGWASDLYDYDGLRFARLCAYLRRREPDTAINHGLLVFRVTEADLQAALFGPPVEAHDPPAAPGARVPQ